jgi:hypothetical protein
MEKSSTLNLPGNLTDAEWDKVMDVYQAMNGWLDGQDLPCWYGPPDSAQFIAASIEPSGLQISGNVPPLMFEAWVTKLCAKLTLALGREVYDAEMG